MSFFCSPMMASCNGHTCHSNTLYFQELYKEDLSHKKICLYNQYLKTSRGSHGYNDITVLYLRHLLACLPKQGTYVELTELGCIMMFRGLFFRSASVSDILFLGVYNFFFFFFLYLFLWFVYFSLLCLLCSIAKSVILRTLTLVSRFNRKGCSLYRSVGEETCSNPQEIIRALGENSYVKTTAGIGISQ